MVVYYGQALLISKKMASLNELAIFIKTIFYGISD